MMLRYQTDEPRAVITIDDPDRMNPMSVDVMEELASAIWRASADPQVRVIVITGAGEKAFSAGGDLSGGFVDSPAALHGARAALGEVFRALRRCGKPTVARVNGHALGGGFGLAAGCDIVIVADHATLGTPEIKVGLWPMMITVALLPLVPRRPLLEMMMTGRRISAAEAKELGIVSRVVSGAELDAAVDETVSTLASQSAAALSLGKDAFYVATEIGFDAALDHLHNGLTAISMTADASEGIAAFGEKRAPRWSGD